jgi:hypothetical protein
MKLFTQRAEGAADLLVQHYQSSGFYSTIELKEFRSVLKYTIDRSSMMFLERYKDPTSICSCSAVLALTSKSTVGQMSSQFMAQFSRDAAARNLMNAEMQAICQQSCPQVRARFLGNGKKGN